jgi:hypothetical protein
MPLTLVGHLIAAHAKANGVKIDRPLDYEAGLRAMRNGRS